jgi:hypothetical protein
VASLARTAPHPMQRSCETPVSNFDAEAAWSVIQS